MKLILLRLALLFLLNLLSTNGQSQIWRNLKLGVYTDYKVTYNTSSLVSFKTNGGFSNYNSFYTSEALAGIINYHFDLSYILNSKFLFSLKYGMSTYAHTLTVKDEIDWVFQDFRTGRNTLKTNFLALGISHNFKIVRFPLKYGLCVNREIYDFSGSQDIVVDFNTKRKRVSATFRLGSHLRLSDLLVLELNLVSTKFLKSYYWERLQTETDVLKGAFEPLTLGLELGLVLSLNALFE